ncbi:hypothetical protein HK405_007216, partial [Cladochytrium tenue]
MDRELDEAEKKKQATKLYVASLRSEFLQLLGELKEADPSFDRNAIQIDPYLRKDI